MSRPFWHREEGSIALTLSWFMVISLLFAIGLDSLLGVYLAQRRAQTAVTAAGMALTREIGVYMPDAVRSETARLVSIVLSDPDVASDIRDAIDQMDKAQELCKVTPLCIPMTSGERAKAIRAIRMDAYQAAFHRQCLSGHSCSGDLTSGAAAMIADDTWSSADATTLMDAFIPDDRALGTLVLKTVTTHQDTLLDVAAELAMANGTSLDRAETALSLPGGWHKLVVRRRTDTFGADWLFDGGGVPTLAVKTYITVDHVGHRTLQYP